jgi:PKD repeat protein
MRLHSVFTTSTAEILTMSSCRRNFVLAVLAAACVSVAAAAAPPIASPSAHRLSPPPVLERLDGVDAGSATGVALRRLAELQGAPHGVSGFFDRRTGRPAVVELSHSLLPPTEAGRGDDATRDALAAGALAFLAEHRDLFGVAPAELALDREASKPSMPVEVDGAVLYRLWHLIFQWAPHGEPVEEARVVFRVNHGNLIQVAVENVGEARQVPRPGQVRRVAAAAAWGRVEERLGRSLAPGSQSSESALRLVAVAPAGDGESAPGLAYRHVWVLRFEQEEGGGERWEATVDAETGELLGLRPASVHGMVLGDVRPAGEMSSEITVGMPYADYASGQYADRHGSFLLASGPLASELQGARVAITDHCGAISVGGDGSGGIDFGGVAGSGVCNGAGGAGDGNTAAARTAYYWVNQAILAAESRFSLPWSAGAPLKVKTNHRTPAFSELCKAEYNHLEDRIYLWRSTFLCGNTGENASHVLHEAGHAIDFMDGTPYGNDFASTEAYGDIVSFLHLDDSCIARDTGYLASVGGTFVPGCGVYSGNHVYHCLACDGFRDVDWRKHQEQQPMTPARALSLCPAGTAGFSPCGRATHCEGAAASEAIYDLYEELQAAGMDAGSARAELFDLFYSSRPSGGSMYTCQYATTTREGGAAAGSLYYTLRAADDCDGNLANGTPHGAAIFAALDRHEIAVGTASDPANQNDTTVPVAGFSWSCVDSNCTFNGGSSTPASGLVSYTWTFGDGGTASGLSVGHQYLASGTYSVKLTVRDLCGRTASRTRSVPVVTAAVPMAQVGSFDINGLNWITVNLSRTFTNPVVIAQPVSRSAWLPVSVVRIFNVTPTSFSARLQSETSMPNPQYQWESVFFLVVEAGSWQLQGSNALLQAGKLTTGASVGHRFLDSWATVTFPRAFPVEPVILSQVQTASDWAFVSTRQSAASATSFKVAMEGFEVDPAAHGSEAIGWVAITPGNGLWGASKYHASNLWTVTDLWSTVNYSVGGCNSSWQGSHFLAGLGSYNERHAHARYQWLTSYPGTCSVQVNAEEDTTWDAETSHAAEELDFFVVVGGGLRNAHALP